VVVRELVTKLGYDLDEANLRTYEVSAQKLAKGMQNVGRKMTTYVTLPIVAAGVLAVRAFGQQRDALAQVQAGIEATGGAAGRSLGQLSAQAKRLQSETLFGDEEILRKATANLLTFTQITGEQFDRTQRAVLDVSTRIGQDLTSTSIQLGKALNDPVANLGALSRSGIQFTKDQKELIKSLWESGQAAQAQTLILDELEKQYGGSAKAAAEASSGFKQMGNALGDLGEAFGELFYPIVQAATGLVKSFAEWLAELPTGFKWIVVGILGLVASIGPLILVGGTLLSFVTFLIANGSIVLGILGMVGGVLGAIAGFLVTIVAPAAIILLILQDIITWLQGGESVFGAFVGPVEDFMDNVVFWLDLIKQWFANTWDGIVSKVTGFLDVLGGIADAVGGFFGLGGDGGAPVGALATAGGNGGTTTSIQGGPITVNVPAGTPGQQVEDVYKAVDDAVKRGLTAESRRVVNSSPVQD